MRDTYLVGTGQVQHGQAYYIYTSKEFFESMTGTII
jgi:hypothetical protein